MAIPTVGYPQNKVPRSNRGLPKSYDVIIFDLKRQDTLPPWNPA